MLKNVITYRYNVFITFKTIIPYKSISGVSRGVAKGATALHPGVSVNLKLLL